MQIRGFKQDLRQVPATGKVRRVLDTHVSPRQHTKGLALLALNVDSAESSGSAVGSV